MSHGVLPSQIRTRDNGRSSASAMTSGGGANGQAAARAIGYSGISEPVSAAVLVKVSDISTRVPSFLDMDGQCGTCRSCAAGALGLLGGRVLVEQDDDAVVVPLVENFGRIHDAVPRRCADVLIDSHFHYSLFTRAASRAPTTGPRSRQ